jgi:hypothetical protein
MKRENDPDKHLFADVCDEWAYLFEYEVHLNFST